MAVIAPESSKAATLGDQEVVHVGLADIAKWEDGPDGSLYVYGRATTPEIDTDDQIVSSEFSAKALQEWLDTAPALRVQHNGQRDPAGSGVRVEINRDGDGAHWVKGVVDEPVAQRLVRKGHLRAFSVGIAQPVIERDPSGRARGGVIKGGRICEVSLVDSPANRSCFLELAKADTSGAPEFTGKVFGATDVITKDRKPPKIVSVDLPADMSLSIKPSDLARLQTLKQRLTVEQAATKAAAVTVAKAAEPDTAKADLKDSERAGMPASDFAYVDAQGGRHLPVHDEGHVRSALGRFAQQEFASPAARKKAARKIVSRARSMGIDLGEHGTVVAAAKIAQPSARKAPKGECPTCKGRGWVKSGNVECTACAGSGKVKGAAKTAEPDVAKCGCDAGMMDGKPCTKCKAGKKAGKRMAAKAAAPRMTKKKKVMCGNCGARQNRKHNACSECGKDLAGAIPVMKNHAYTCLGCGKDLDKGEKFCPGCGKGNPGYLPEADHQIPANRAAEKTAKGKKKAGKKGKPFGGAQAPPFGAKDKDTDDDSAGKAARVIKGKKGKKGKPGKQTPGSAGGVPGNDEKPVPEHRDAATEETFERPGSKEASAAPLAHDPEMAAAMTLKALGVPAHLGALHALTCPAYSPESVAKAFPNASFAGIDATEWMNEAASKAASAPLDQAMGAMALWHNANALRNADPYLLADLRTAAHKAFRDANPGPGTFPEPGEIGPARFNRPYLSEGHAAASPGHDGPHSARLPEVGGINSQDYTRGYLTSGHAAESPESPAHPAPMTTPAHTGIPTQAPNHAYVSTTATEGASHALNAMHDHISRVFPDICPMDASAHIAEHPVPVPHGVPTPSRAPGARKAAKVKRREKAARAKARKRAAAKRRRLEKAVLKGKVSVDDARVKLGLDPVLAKAATAAPTAPEDAPSVAAALDPEAFAAAVTKATKPLVKRIAAQDKTLRKQGKVLDAIASQPDTTGAPFRGVALPKSSAAPAGPLTATGLAEQAQVTKLRLLHEEWRNSPNPEQREAAYAEYTRQLGIASMTPPT